jgi:hypothetical protein
LRRVFYFGILAKVADENDFVNAFRHECRLLKRVTIAERGEWKLWYLDMRIVTSARLTSELPESDRARFTV